MTAATQQRHTNTWVWHVVSAILKVIPFKLTTSIVKQASFEQHARTTYSGEERKT